MNRLEKIACAAGAVALSILGYYAGKYQGKEEEQRNSSVFNLESVRIDPADIDRIAAFKEMGATADRIPDRQLTLGMFNGRKLYVDVRKDGSVGNFGYYGPDFKD